MGKPVRVLAAMALLVAAGCGTDAGRGAVTAEAGGMRLAVVSPVEGSVLAPPFTVEVSSSMPLGEPETGRHHVHIFFDGDDSEYALMYGDRLELTEFPAALAPGEHVLNASLRNADHSAAGVEAEVAVTVGEGGAGPVPGTDGY